MSASSAVSSNVSVAFPDAHTECDKQVSAQRQLYYQDFRMRIHVQLQAAKNWVLSLDKQMMQFRIDVEYTPSMIFKVDLDRIKQQLFEAHYSTYNWIENESCPSEQRFLAITFKHNMKDLFQ
jgi:hypothetical protein